MSDEPEFLELLTDSETSEVNSRLAPFADLLLLRDNAGWECRHDQLSERILQYYLAARFDEQWRYKLADFASSIIRRVDGYSPGGDVAAEYVWSVLNPQLDFTALNSDFAPRLIRGQDGIPENPGRHLVYHAAADQFPEHVLIVSHFGKFLSEVEHKFSEAERYFTKAVGLEPNNEAVLHMMGKRYSDEVRAMMKLNPPGARSSECQERIDALTKAAHLWFDRARDSALGSEYNYTTAMQLNIRLIQDEFRRLGIHSATDDPTVLSTERVAALLSHTEAIAAQGLNYIAPIEEQRWYFTQVRDELHKLRGDLEMAIGSFEERLPRMSGSHLSAAQIQLARLYKERAERKWLNNQQKAASKDFEIAERHLHQVLDDPARKFDNIRLWFDCARFLAHWTREDLMDRLHDLHNNHASLDTSFLLACLYFADAVETGSVTSWRKHQESQSESARRSANYTVRTFIREWLVQVPTSRGKEHRIFPNHLIARDEDADAQLNRRSPTDARLILTGIVARVVSSTVASLKIEPMGFEVFFKPRVHDKRFYKQDEGVARVSFAVAFTYEKPMAYDVQRLS